MRDGHQYLHPPFDPRNDVNEAVCTDIGYECCSCEFVRRNDVDTVGVLETQHFSEGDGGQRRILSDGSLGSVQARQKFLRKKKK